MFSRRCFCVLPGQNYLQVVINLSIVIFTSRRVLVFFSASVFVTSCNTNKIAKSKTEKSEAAKPKLVKADETYVAFRTKKGT